MKSQNDIKLVFIDQLRSMSEMPTKIIESLWDMGETVYYPKNKIMQRPNQIHSHGNFLYSGVIMHYSMDLKHKKHIHYFNYGSGFLINSMAIYLRIPSPRLYSITLTDIVVRQINYQELFVYAGKHPIVYNSLLGMIVSTYRERENKEIDFKLKTSIQLYEKLLVDYPDIVDHVPLNYLASYLNIHPGSLSRIRKNLRN